MRKLLNMGGISAIAFASADSGSGGTPDMTTDGMGHNLDGTAPEGLEPDDADSGGTPDDDDADSDVLEDVAIGDTLEPEIDPETGSVILPDARIRREWKWADLPVGGAIIVSMDEAPSARSSANSFGKGTKGGNGKPAREPREFGSQTVKVRGDDGKPVKAVKIFRRS